MNRRILGFYYIISMLFLLFILLFAAYRLKITIDGNREESEKALENLRISALSIYLAEGDFDGEYFRTTMRKSFSETDRLLLLAIYSSREGIYYLISRDESYLSAAPEQSDGAPWRGEPEYTVRPVYENRITRRFSPGIRQDLLIDGTGKYHDYNFYRVAGLAIGGKDKGEAENEAEPVDVRSLMP